MIILHGLFQVSGDLKITNLYRSISDSHYTKTVEYLPDPYDSRIKSAKGNIKDYGVNLKSEIEELKTSTGAEKVDIIGYSMGLVARWYIEKLGGDRSTGKLIMLGTPNHGSYTGNWFEKTIYRHFFIKNLIIGNDPDTAILEMEPHSEFLIELNGNSNCYSQNNRYNNLNDLSAHILLYLVKITHTGPQTQLQLHIYSCR